MSRPNAWVGPRCYPGTEAGPRLPTALHEAYGRELAKLLELIRSGEAFCEPSTAERLSICLVGVLTRLHEEHQVDEHGRCLICSPPMWWWPWQRRARCTVDTAFGAYFPCADQPGLRGRS